MLLEPSFEISPKGSTPKTLPKLPELRKSVIDEIPELFSDNKEYIKLLDPNNFADTTSILMHDFVATAYCIKGFTACGVPTGVGVVAADPKILPLGSIVRIEAGKYSGLYKVLDTGPGVRGKRLDIYVPARSEARSFGRQNIRLEIVRYGWGNANKLEELAEGQ
jgi:3D (Asp-Asp-Asp) domain-containing protein